MKNVTPNLLGTTWSEDADRRLRRLRRVAWILDRLIPLGGGRRFGIDPVIGLIPGIGDWIATLLCVYVLYEAARLGLPLRVLARIAFNIALEGIIGTVPVAGDLFDFIFQANMRNLRLVEEAYRPDMRPRPLGHIWIALALFTFALLLVVALAVFALVELLLAMLS